MQICNYIVLSFQQSNFLLFLLILGPLFFLCLVFVSIKWWQLLFLPLLFSCYHYYCHCYCLFLLDKNPSPFRLLTWKLVSCHFHPWCLVRSAKAYMSGLMHPKWSFSIWVQTRPLQTTMSHQITQIQTTLGSMVTDHKKQISDTFAEYYSKSYASECNTGSEDLRHNNINPQPTASIRTLWEEDLGIFLSDDLQKAVLILFMQ